MKISKIKSSLTNALNAESHLYKAKNQLLQECQSCCEDEILSCEYLPADGFCLGYETGDCKYDQISVTTFIKIASKSKRKLKLSDFEYLC